MRPFSALFDAWESFIHTGRAATTIIAPPILRSWQRCAANGLDPNAPAPDAPQLAPERSHSALRDLARPSMEDLYQFVEGSGFAVLLFDQTLCLIDQIGDPAMIDLISILQLGVGGRWSEERIGTIAVNLALAEAMPWQTRAAEHYCRAYHQLTCSAAPLFDVSGSALGILGVFGPSDAAHAHTLGMVIAAAQAIHIQLRNDLLMVETNDHLAELSAVVEAMSEGILFIDPQGRLSKINSHASQLLGLAARGVTGRPLDELIVLPLPLHAALERRQELADQELLFESRKGPIATRCSMRPVWDRGRQYRGALITLRPLESVQRLVQRVVGAQARFTFADILGESSLLQSALRHARIAAYSPAPVLLEGEAGVGKELFAHAIHHAGARADGPFVMLNCAAVPRSLLLGELIGHEVQHSGESTIRSPAESRPGKLELAQAGTLLLEEIGALSPEAQTSLLRVIETNHLIRLGGRRVVPLDVRIIATTTVALQTDVNDGRFRADLLLRLSVLPIRIPPLRDRGDDTLLLITHLLATINRRLGKQTLLAPDALAALCAYPWPGNVRELETAIERLLHLTEKSVLTIDDLPSTISRHMHGSSVTPPRLHDRHAIAEREAILRACRETGGHLTNAAERLGISRATLWRKMKRYQITV